MSLENFNRLVFDGLLWTIAPWSGPNVIPSSASLGFETQSRHTRLQRHDLFGLKEERLVLLRSEVNLVHGYEDFAPVGAGRDYSTRCLTIHDDSPRIERGA